MVGKTAGVVSRIKEVTNNCSNSHCILHRQALVIKKMPIPLKNVLDEAVKIINFVKSRPLSTRLFTILCEDPKCAQITTLPYRSKIAFSGENTCTFT